MRNCLVLFSLSGCPAEHLLLVGRWPEEAERGERSSPLSQRRRRFPRKGETPPRHAQEEKGESNSLLFLLPPLRSRAAAAASAKNGCQEWAPENFFASPSPLAWRREPSKAKRGGDCRAGWRPIDVLLLLTFENLSDVLPPCRRKVSESKCS
jgi:hypothetical protein